MKLLLDTHVAIWAAVGDPRLSDAARNLIVDPDNDIVVSAVTLWEIAIKYGLGRGDMPLSAPEARDVFAVSDYEIMPVDAEHALAVAALPRLHGDPFDRMLVAQALHEQLRLITHDKVVAGYSDTFILV